MSREIAITLLRQKGQRITDKRTYLLSFLMKTSKSYAFPELEEKLAGYMDRVTIYRILNTFESHKLVMKMVDQQGIFRYFFHQKIDDHISTPQLRCKDCHTVVQLPCLPEEYLQKLAKYKIDGLHFLMDGLCEECIHSRVK